MKIELSEIDKENIESINKTIEDGNEPCLFINNVGADYFINFTCTDIAKANIFIATLLSNTENSKKIQDTLGIKVNSINYCEGDTKIAALKNYLTNFLEMLENM
jgi:hypothetical protein